jgi:hypothetical protein
MGKPDSPGVVRIGDEEEESRLAAEFQAAKFGALEPDRDSVRLPLRKISSLVSEWLFAPTTSGWSTYVWCLATPRDALEGHRGSIPVCLYACVCLFYACVCLFCVSVSVYG